jgi:hypothetical protein
MERDIARLIINEPIQGQTKELWETYMEYQTHTDDSVTVTQLPDVKEGDVVVVGSVDYGVRRVFEWPAAGGLLPFIRVVLEESKP